MDHKKIVSLAGKRAELAPEREFLQFIDRDMDAAPAMVQPLPSSLLERYQALKSKMHRILDEERMEG